MGPGDKLPTVRALAKQLRVSPATVAAAYKGLQTRGLLLGGGRNGTTVARAGYTALKVCGVDLGAWGTKSNGTSREIGEMLA